MTDKVTDQTHKTATSINPYIRGDQAITQIGLAETVQKLAAVVDSHIGSGVNAHTPVAHYQSGFMTPMLLAKLYEIAGKRTYTGGGRDIMTLDPGCYYGLKFKNGPLAADDDALATVDVSKFEDFGKQIVVIKSYTGQTYLYTEHKNSAGTNYAAPSIWTSIPRFANLWEGSLSTVGTKFTLADRIDKYTRLIFTINTNNGAVYDVTTISGGDTFKINTFQRQNTGPGMNNFEVTLTISGTSGSVTKNVSDAYNAGATGPVVASNLGRVVKIVGVLE
ncbi:hypothetical protein [Pediococcus pentosaceus]|uniref:hypothetical protein n=1 Tax=Pediococcus pentosaceus TaxID=1255 RepID=UPI001E5E27A0|nr:hypothetical protein [Pediococcus pentosaceus]MCG7196509.1 hypothetical protein [Pediococcus pentosaceus]MCI2396181.1 hypothetical protein [Pediococcus pentosaceus]